MSTTTCIVAIVAAVLILAAVIRLVQDFLDHQHARRILRRNGFFDQDPSDGRSA